MTEQCCCEGRCIPATLIASLSVTFGCLKWNGQTLPVTWNGTRWEGSLTITGNTLTIYLECDEGCHFHLSFKCDDGEVHDLDTSSDHDCDPFHVHAEYNQLDGPECGCSTIILSNWDFDITED